MFEVRDVVTVIYCTCAVYNVMHTHCTVTMYMLWLRRSSQIRISAILSCFLNLIFTAFKMLRILNLKSQNQNKIRLESN